jgi:L-iditol 2-dehydrogenase
MANEADVAVAAGRSPDLPRTMRAAVLFGPGDLRVVDRDVPAPGPDEVLVRVAMCGACGTDLKIYDGHFRSA